MKKFKVWLLLFLILLLGFFLRVNQVTQIPPSLNWDEVSIAYNAYSILRTGHDEWGQFMPLHFMSYGEFKLPAQIYASIPGIYIFGLNEFGVRITPVVYGTLTILLLFFLGRKLFKSDLVGMLAAFCLAVSPWHIQLTRGSFESSFATFWIVLGMWLLIKGFEKKIYLIWAMIPLVIAVYTYNTARIFVPLFLISTLVVYYKDLIKFKKQILVAFILFFVMMTPLIPFFMSGEGNARLKLVSITDDPGLIPRINERRGNSKLIQPFPRLVHNKVTYVGFYYARNYLAHFSPDYLFISGAPHKQHHVQGVGQLYLFQAPFLLLGLYLLFRKKHKFRWFLVSWILITHIPVALTNDSVPHALRNLIANPAYQLISAFGLVEAVKYFKTLNQKKPKILINYLAAGIVVGTFVFQFPAYLNNYYTDYSKLYSRDWQYGYKQVVEYIKQNQDKYDQVIFTRHYGEPHMFTLFYESYDPAKFQNIPNLMRFETHDWVRVYQFDNYLFPDLGDSGTQYKDFVAQNQNKKILFIGKAGDFPVEVKRLKTVNFLNNQPAFEIVEKL